jgi:hypothetical protein
VDKLQRNVVDVTRKHGVPRSVHLSGGTQRGVAGFSREVLCIFSQHPAHLAHGVGNVPRHLVNVCTSGGRGSPLSSVFKR